MNGRFEMGRRLLSLDRSKPGLFNMGLIAAVVREAGTFSDRREERMMLEMRGTSEERQVLTRVVGRGSS